MAGVLRVRSPIWQVLAAIRETTREAGRLYSESIELFRDLGHKRGIARVLECMAASAAAQCKAEQALRLAGAAASLRQRLGAPLAPAEQFKLERSLEVARRALSNADGLAAWMEGWAMPVEQAVQEALRSEGESSRDAGALARSFRGAGIDHATYG